MKKLTIIIVIVVGVAIIAGLMLFGQNGGGGTAPSSTPVAQTGATASTTSTPSTPTPATSTATAPSAPAAPMAATVAYTDSGFSPKTVTIAKGGTVTWVNNASDAMHVASDPHPIHNGYPTTGGCVGSTFDACKNIAPGTSWSFTFTFVGSWGYHNHLNPSEKGTVVVAP